MTGRSRRRTCGDDQGRRTDGNMIEPMLAAARAEATLGEMRNALRAEWGEYVEPRASERSPNRLISVSAAITLREADKSLGCARGGARGDRGRAAHRNRVCAGDHHGAGGLCPSLRTSASAVAYLRRLAVHRVEDSRRARQRARCSRVLVICTRRSVSRPTALQAGWSVQSHVSMRSIHQSFRAGRPGAAADGGPGQPD